MKGAFASRVEFLKPTLQSNFPWTLREALTEEVEDLQLVMPQLLVDHESQVRNAAALAYVVCLHKRGAEPPQLFSIVNGHNRVRNWDDLVGHAPFSAALLDSDGFSIIEQALRSGTYLEQWAALDSLSILGPFAQRIVPFVTTFLESPNQDVRRAAASALAQIVVERDDKVLNTLLEVASEPQEDWKVRCAAAKALGQLGRGMGRVSTTLMQIYNRETLVAGENCLVENSLVEALLGDLQHGEAITAVITRLKDRASASAVGTDDVVDVAAATNKVFAALLSLGSRAQPHLKELQLIPHQKVTTLHHIKRGDLLEAVTDPVAFAKSCAENPNPQGLRSLRAMRQYAACAAPRLLWWVEGSLPIRQRNEIIGTIAVLLKDTGQEVKELVARLYDSPKSTQYAAAAALGEIGFVSPDIKARVQTIADEFTRASPLGTAEELRGVLRALHRFGGEW